MTKRAQAARALAALGVGLVVSLPVAAAAQNYPGPPPPQVLGETIAREVPTQVLGETVTRGDTLPVTGGDVLGLTALGLGAIATGAVLVRRSRTRPA